MMRTQPITALNAFDAADIGSSPSELRGLLERRDRLFGGTSYLMYDDPLHVARASGVWLYDPLGEAYLDAYNNVPSIGHCHPAVVEAISDQAARLNTNTRYLYDIVYDYAERLLATFPNGLSTIAFTCTGSESSDLALRVARAYTGGQGAVVTSNAYHGNTTAVAAISPASGPDVPIGQDVRTVRTPDTLRYPAAHIGARFAEDVEAAFANLRRHGVKPAALIMDTIFSSDGVYPDPGGFLVEGVAAARAAGALIVADEVQPGFGRTGVHMWGFGRHALSPDLVILGKPMGNGFPVAGVVARREVLAGFSQSSGYFNTFGGNPLAAAAGLAVLEVIEREGLIANAGLVGDYLTRGLKELAVRFPLVADVRSAGLYTGVEICCPGTVSPDVAMTKRIINGLRKRRILVSSAGVAGNVLKIRPPLCFSQQNADSLLHGLAEVLETASQ
jgi:4-aminobutyrate aminotransferase-like enzyme